MGGGMAMGGLRRRAASAAALLQESHCSMVLRHR